MAILAQACFTESRDSLACTWNVVHVLGGWPDKHAHEDHLRAMCCAACIIHKTGAQMEEFCHAYGHHPPVRWSFVRDQPWLDRC
mmetsp:Transcript_7456/g.8138  ORF Transcript_7456/g.8138 Transcript_7456/m.8138 type:complete len:84 (-) Transcript_7456:52-303(-)